MIVYTSVDPGVMIEFIKTLIQYAGILGWSHLGLYDSALYSYDIDDG